MVEMGRRGKYAPVILLFFITSVLFVKHGQWALQCVPDYLTYAVSDWLINYEAGFVRRGLLGQLLFEAWQVHPFNVREFVLLLPFVFSPLLMALLLMVFYKERWQPMVIFTVCCLGSTFLASTVRRDYLVLVMVFFVFMAMSQWLRHRRWIDLCAFFLLSVTLVLIYEPSVFITFPLLFVILRRKAVLLALPIVLACLAVFTSRGDAAMAQTIWQSWEPCFLRYPYPSDNSGIGLGVEALGWNVFDTFAFHLRLAYVGIKPSLLTIPLICYMLAGTYYLMVCHDVAKVPFWPRRPENPVVPAKGSADGEVQSSAMLGLSNVLLFQFVAMLPMFTVLSCDWGRNITLCCVSTFFMLHFFPNAGNQIPHLAKVSKPLLSLFDRHRWLRSPYLYVFVALTIPMPISEAPQFGDSILGLLIALLT